MLVKGGTPPRLKNMIIYCDENDHIVVRRNFAMHTASGWWMSCTVQVVRLSNSQLISCSRLAIPDPVIGGIRLDIGCPGRKFSLPRTHIF